MKTGISIKLETKFELDKIKRPIDSYDSLIKMLLKFYKEKMEGGNANELV